MPTVTNMEILKALVEIKSELKALNENLKLICEVQTQDRIHLWKIATICIVGLFAIAGIKIAGY